jgi:hypothetical protein
MAAAMKFINRFDFGECHGVVLFEVNMPLVLKGF